MQHEKIGKKKHCAMWYLTLRLDKQVFSTTLLLILGLKRFGIVVFFQFFSTTWVHSNNQSRPSEYVLLDSLPLGGVSFKWTSAFLEGLVDVPWPLSKRFYSSVIYWPRQGLFSNWFLFLLNLSGELNCKVQLVVVLTCNACVYWDHCNSHLSYAL